MYLVTQSVLESVIGNRSCYRKTRSADNIHTKANANIMLLCVVYADNVNIRGVHSK